jgi:hypothetical protein
MQVLSDPTLQIPVDVIIFGSGGGISPAQGASIDTWMWVSLTSDTVSGSYNIFGGGWNTTMPVFDWIPLPQGNGEGVVIRLNWTDWINVDEQNDLVQYGKSIFVAQDLDIPGDFLPSGAVFCFAFNQY